MKTVEVGKLTAGQVAEHDYYSSSGELLLTRGVVISGRHLDILKRRNIFELYLRGSDEFSELHQMLSTDFKQLDNLDITYAEPVDNPRALSTIPELRQIKVGEEGLKQLLSSDKSMELDRELRSGHISDRPIGPAMKTRLQQIAVSMRTEQYKEEVQIQYGEALRRVRTILNKLADAQKVDGGEIRSLVELFMKIFINDRNILLSLSWSKHESDEYIYHHTLNVCLLSLNIAASAGYNEEQIVQIGTGALLHDVGMLLVPRAIRLKQGRLVGDEWYEVQKHPVMGLHILEKISHLPEAVPYVAYQLHERENGKGYPKQRTGRFIHCFAKIVQCADIFEAISSPRTYRKALAPYQGMETLIKMTRQGLLQGEFVKAFLSYTSLFPVGSIVELNDSRIGKVVAANESSFTKPVISVLCDKRGEFLPSSQIYQVDLSQEFDIQVVRCLPFESMREIGILEGL